MCHKYILVLGATASGAGYVRFLFDTDWMLEIPPPRPRLRVEGFSH